MMTKSTKDKGIEFKTREDAKAIARSIQKPGQSKEQTKLIAQGIQKGIEVYKKKQNSRAREIDKKRKQTLKQRSQQFTQTNPSSQVPETIMYRQHWLPWLLLLITWVAVVGAYLTCSIIVLRQEAPTCPSL